MPNDYEVGFGRPPVKSQFKPGVSGNPKGRPKRDKSGFHSSILETELYRTVTITEGNRKIPMPIIQAGFRRLMINAVKGHPQSIALALKLSDSYSLDENEKQKHAPQLTNEERAKRLMEILQSAHLRRQRKDLKATNPTKRKR